MPASDQGNGKVVDGGNLFLGRSRAIGDVCSLARIRGSPVFGVGVFFTKLSGYLVRDRSLGGWNDGNVVPERRFLPIDKPYRNAQVNGGEHKTSAESHGNKSTATWMRESKSFLASVEGRLRREVRRDETEYWKTIEAADLSFLRPLRPMPNLFRRGHGFRRGAC